MSHIPPHLFKTRLIQWAQAHGRHDLPWQQDISAYRVLVSEVMLQQTQVTTVMPYFLRWMQSFPTLESLAQAPEDSVMSCWQGLGYYSRARNLQKAARYLCEHHQGLFPQTREALLNIPGVGPYTAGAILSFAYDRPGAIVDGNVKRVFCRLFCIHGDVNQGQVVKKIWNLAEQLTPQTHNRQFAQGLLDLGATLCKPKNPDCHRCPFQNECLAYQNNQVSQLPTPKIKKTLPVRHQTFLWVQAEDHLLLEKRPKQGIWGALWCLPQQIDKPLKKPTEKKLGTFHHTFTHFRLLADVVKIASRPLTLTQQWIKIDNLAAIGLPAPIRRFIEKQLKAD